MKNLKCASFAVLIYLGVCSCNGQKSSTSQTTRFDPVEFGKEFNAVCKVGVKGGNGTLIAQNWILTAGHVASGMYSRTGGNLFVYFDDGSEYKVKQVFLHPAYQAMGKYDIALLQLETDVPGIQPFKTYKEEDELNKMIYLAGHGDKRNPDGTWIKDGIKRGYTNRVDLVNDTHLVFDYDAPGGNGTEREGTSGPGDSGGPALIKKAGAYYVAGISSMGEPGKNGPASYGAIEHFVRVSKFQGWIDETMSNSDAAKNFKGAGPDKNVDKQNSDITLEASARANAAMQIVNALGDYSEEKMTAAIAATYDENILQKRSPGQIIQNMPFLIKELQHTKLSKTVEETTSKISFQLEKGVTKYLLDIYFIKDSDKIEQLAFGRLN